MSLKIKQNSLKNVFTGISFLMKLQVGNLKITEPATVDVLEKKVLKIL